MPLPSNLSFVGIAKESTKGTGVASTAYLPTKDFKPVDVVQQLTDEGYRGAMVDAYNIVGGPQFSTYELGGDVFPDSIGWPLAGVLGDVTTTGASAPFSHAMAVKNSGDGQPTSYSITDFYGLSGGTPARRFPGLQFSEVSFKITADQLMTYTAKMTGFVSATVAKPTTSWSTVTPTPAWLNTLTVSASTKTFLEEAEINFKRPVTVIHTSDGTAAPYAVWLGPLTVDGKVTFVHEDDTELTRYLTGTNFTFAIDSTAGAGAGLTEVKFNFSKLQYTAAELDRSKDYVETQVQFHALGNTTDVGSSGGYSQVKVTVQNALAASTYV